MAAPTLEPLDGHSSEWFLSIVNKALDLVLNTCWSTVDSHGFYMKSFGSLYVKNRDNSLFPTDGATDRT